LSVKNLSVLVSFLSKASADWVLLTSTNLNGSTSPLTLKGVNRLFTQWDPKGKILLILNTKIHYFGGKRTRCEGRGDFCNMLKYQPNFTSNCSKKRANVTVGWIMS